MKLFRVRRTITVLWSLSILPIAFAQTGSTGTPDIVPFSQFMTSVNSEYGIPGSTLAITRYGQLILAKGYGLMDQENNIPIQPNTLLRIASCSKTITAVTVMHIVELGKLSLDEPAFALVPDLQAPNGHDADPRLAQITIRELLNHSGGWDDSVSGYDPTGDQQHIANVLGTPSPATSDDMVRYMRTQMLDHDPGTHFAYSNFGYDLLARIIERVVGMSYEQYVRTHVFAPMGIATARIGQTLPQGLLPNESKYYANQKQMTIFPDVTPHFAPVQYGAWYEEGFDGDGGWVISAIDYAKFVDAIAGTGGNAFLKPETIAEMTARPNLPEYNGTSHWYAFGLAVEPTANGQNWWNDGAIDGTFTKWYKRDDGLVMVAFFNSRSNPPGREHALQNAVDNGLITSANSVSSWPTTDYISEFPNADPIQAASAPALNTAEGVRNAATMQRGVVPGSWATLLGVNLEKGWPKLPKFDRNRGVPPVSIGGVSVNINGKPAYLSYVSPTVIQAQVPSDIAPGWVPVEVVNNGVHTTKILTWVTQYAPGAFTYKQEGTVLAVATGSAGRPIDCQNPAKPGEVITLYSTGLVPTTAGVRPSPNEQIDSVSLQIGGQAATVQSATLTSPGIFLIQAVVPNVSLGNQPLVITSHSVDSPANVMIPIGRRRNFVH